MRYYKLFVDGTNSFFTYLDKNEIYHIGDRVLVNFRNKERTKTRCARGYGDFI